LALVAVALVAFSGLAVLAAYAPELRGGMDARPHALSNSAIGLKGAVIMLKGEGAPDVVLRSVSKTSRSGLLVLTPEMASSAADLAAFAPQEQMLIVLPKWLAGPQPLNPGFVDKLGVAENTSHATGLLSAFSKSTVIAHRKGVTRPVLRGGGAVFNPATYLPLADVDQLQTLSGDGWEPALVDDQGRMVLARSRRRPGVLVLADPDLLNTQGLAHLDNARAGMAILDTLRGDEGVMFDVTLNGIKRSRGIGRLMLQPPWLSATLCGVAAALLMGLHGLARFGPVRREGRAIALGKRALVDNSAGLVRMARREHELAPAYAALIKARLSQSAGAGERTQAGEDNERWLAELARQHNAAPPSELAAQADGATNRDDLLAVARRLYFWRREITREGR
jgi:hypothetical protein